MFKNLRFFFALALLVSLFSPFMGAQSIKRQDVIWARATTEPIVLDGVLNEASWAKADSIQIIWNQNPGLPTSGWNAEFQADQITDPIHATVKFLVENNHLYIAFIIPDSSIGGSQGWPKWDGILMNLKDKSSSARPLPVKEIFVNWLFRDSVGADPEYGYGGDSAGGYNLTRRFRSASDIAKWDCGVMVHGITNDDSTPDTGWVAEYGINLDSLGYNANAVGGDIVELNFSIWDADWLHRTNDPTQATASVAKMWWENAFSNEGNDVCRVMVRPDVTVNSGTAPDVPPDVILPNGANLPDPVIDGKLDESVWKGAYSFKIAWGDSVVRSAYPGVGPYQSGQYQPDLAGTGVLPQILAPVTANVKMFFKGQYLYLAADVSDQVIQGVKNYDAQDGVRFTLMARDTANTDHTPVFYKLYVTFDTAGNLLPSEYLPTLIANGGCTYAVGVHGTINTNTDVDTGYTIEMKVDLTKLGYASGLGDHLLFGGIMVNNGDSFDDPTKNYGSRVWWFREHDGGPATPWIYMDPNDMITGVKSQPGGILPTSIVIYGNYPNPFNPSTKVSYSLPRSGAVNFIVYNSIGQLVTKVNLSNQAAGNHVYGFSGASLASGVYFYKIMLNSNTGETFESKTGKMILMK